MGMETTGKIHALFDTQQKTERFRVREFVLETADNPRYPQYVLFQLTGDRCEALDGFGVGDEVRVEFSLRGREWQSPRGETRYFNSLDVWTIDRAGAEQGVEGDRGGPRSPSGPRSASAPPAGDEPPPMTDDDLPF